MVAPDSKVDDVMLCLKKNEERVSDKVEEIRVVGFVFL
jgi:hypothetical protein